MAITAVTVATIGLVVAKFALVGAASCTGLAFFVCLEWLVELT